MVSSLMLAGFGLIALAWIIQLFYITRGNRSVQPLFIGAYIVGVIICGGGDSYGEESYFTAGVPEALAGG